MSDEKLDLESLLQCPGWLRLLEMVRRDWKEGYPAKVKLAIREAREKGGDVALAVEAVDYASDEINALISWPKERLAQLERAKETTTISFTRGGYAPTATR